MSELNWYVGVDWGGRSHQVCVLGGDGAVRGESAFAHTGSGGDGGVDRRASAGRRRRPAWPSRRRAGRCWRACRGTAWRCTRSTPGSSTGSATGTRRRAPRTTADARVLASALRTDPHCRRRVGASALIVVELREWTRMREELKRERVRLTNRMRE